jgi:hypothetical protein
MNAGQGEGSKKRFRSVSIAQGADMPRSPSRRPAGSSRAPHTIPEVASLSDRGHPPGGSKASGLQADGNLPAGKGAPEVLQALAKIAT